MPEKAKKQAVDNYEKLAKKENLKKIPKNT